MDLKTTTETKVARFNVRERTVHWLVALAFLYAALTGLALWSPRLYWIAAIFGGGPTVRAWHPWGGIVFVSVFTAMFVAWKREMRLDSDDRKWLRRAHRYAVHDESGLPEAGRFNAGQKSLFWMQALSGILLLLSGIVLWWPAAMSRTVRELAVLIHPAAAIISIGGLIVHIYMGTAAVPEAFRGMIQGWVTPRWAASHHPKWYREVQKGTKKGSISLCLCVVVSLTFLTYAADSQQNWPSFRGPGASGVAENQNLPDQWDGAKGENVAWRTPIPGLGHSSPIVWGERIFVTTAISSRPDATFRPGLYGDGDASEDRSSQRWMIYAIAKSTGKIVWERAAHQGAPIDKRHIKSTYASSTPVTNGKIVVAWFGSQGVYAYDVDGKPLWKADLGRIDAGAYDLPSYEWGPASSPIIWNDLVIVQCDSQGDSFIAALRTDTGKVAWKTRRDELPSWGTPNVFTASAGPELVTNGSNFIRGYDPRTGKELWRLGGSSKITAPTPVADDGLIVVASGRAPERPIFAVRPGARGDITLRDGQTGNKRVVWSHVRRGPYMPTPLIYRGIVYILDNAGIFDAYDLKTGRELYRQRLPYVGSGFSASPVAADGKIYLSSEDGEMIVIAAGPVYKHFATNSIGDLLMATPAISEGVMYVRSKSSLFAITARR